VLNSSNKELLKNSTTLIVGTITAQAIPLLLQPLLRRYYLPEEFGALAVYLNLFGIVTIVSSLRYEAAIMLPNNNLQAANVLALSVILSAIFNFLLFLILLFFSEQIFLFIGIPAQYKNFLFFLPFSGFAFSVYQAINYWLIRQKAFKASTINKINRRFTEGLFQVAGGFLNLKGGLFWGDFIGNITNFISGIRQIYRTTFSITYLSKRKLFAVLKKYKEFPIYNTVPTLASSLASTLPYLYINKFYSTAVVAIVDLSRLALSVPLVLISGTVSQVLFQDITSKIRNKQSIVEPLAKMAYLLLALFTIEFLIVEFSAPWLFTLVFGDTYRASGQLSQLLIIMFGFSFFSSTFSFILIAFQKLRLNALWQTFYLAAIASLYFFKNWSFNNFISLFVGIDAFCQLTLLIIIFYIIKNYKPEKL
jgi:O-antigen/teichoic acid export membrane protein